MSQPTGIIGSIFNVNKLLVVELVLASIVLYPVWRIIYNLFFHPLRKFPGPRLAAATQLKTSRVLIKGQPIEYIQGLHEKYGPVVRIKPNELSFITETAWNDIYMHRQGKPQMEKVMRECWEPDGTPNIHSGGDEDHARQRRAIAHAFSEKALREQEPLIQRYLDVFISNVRDQVKNGTAFNIIEHINWAAFDIIGDLSFGEPFGALQSKETHPWIRGFFASALSATPMFEFLEFIGPYWKEVVRKHYLMPKILKHAATMQDLCKTKLEERFDKGADTRPDFMTFVLKNMEAGKGMTKRETISTFNVVINAGSETIGTTLAGTIFSLLRTPRTMRKLKEEIYTAFEKESDIDVSKTYQLPYLNAVLQESLRVYPSAAIAIRRFVEPEGTTISGYYVPGGTVVGIPQPAANSSALNFSEPKSFIPERWIETTNPKFANDKRGVFKPFSAGARNCVGQNLANSEMRLILARLLFNFDLELEDPEQDWIRNQQVFTIRVKPPLMVKAKVAQRAK